MFKDHPTNFSASMDNIKSCVTPHFFCEKNMKIASIVVKAMKNVFWGKMSFVLSISAIVGAIRTFLKVPGALGRKTNFFCYM